MDLLQTRNFTRERLTNRIRYIRRRLSESYSHYIEHTHRKRTSGEHIGRTRRGKRDP